MAFQVFRGEKSHFPRLFWPFSQRQAVSKNDQVASLASLARRRPPGAPNGSSVEERRPLGILSEVGGGLWFSQLCG